MSNEEEPTFNQFLDELMPFGDWLATLEPSRRAEAEFLVAELNYEGCPAPEAVVRRDFSSHYAEVTRERCLGAACRKAEDIWRLRSDGECVIGMVMAGRRLPQGFEEITRFIRAMLDAGLSDKEVSEFGRFVARFAAANFLHHIDHESDTQLTDYVIAEVVGNRFTGRQASGGKWQAMMGGRAVYDPGNPLYPIRAKRPGSSDGTGTDAPA